MKNLKDKYNLGQLSRTNKIGFDSFQDSETKLYYFHFNNGEDIPILFSQAYKSKKGRDNGIVALKGCLSNNESIQRNHRGGRQYFCVKAANNQEIARSRNFSSPDEVEAAIVQMLNFVFSKKANKENVRTIEKKKKKTNQPVEQKHTQETELLATIKTSTKGTTKVDIPILEKSDLNNSINKTENVIRSAKELVTTKSAFRIDFYQSEEPNSYHGRIVHLLSKERKNFQGLDVKAIFQFIEKYLNPSLTDQQITTANPSVIASKITRHNHTPSQAQTLEQHLATHGISMTEQKLTAMVMKQADSQTSNSQKKNTDNAVGASILPQSLSISNVPLAKNISSMVSTPVTLAKRSMKERTVSQEEHLAFYGLPPLSPISLTRESSNPIITSTKMESALSKNQDITKKELNRIRKNNKLKNTPMTQEEHLAFHCQLGELQQETD